MENKTFEELMVELETIIKKLESTDISLEEAKKDSASGNSATSKFFQQSDSQVFGDGDDDVFVGEIEDNRKPNKVMIGDGEEGEAEDFEFL